jgi:hypothetical protein
LKNKKSGLSKDYYKHIHLIFKILNEAKSLAIQSYRSGLLKKIMGWQRSILPEFTLRITPEASSL